MTKISFEVKYWGYYDGPSNMYEVSIPSYIPLSSFWVDELWERQRPRNGELFPPCFRVYMSVMWIIIRMRHDQI
jgi:hypothetical protein